LAGSSFLKLTREEVILKNKFKTLHEIIDFANAKKIILLIHHNERFTEMLKRAVVRAC
jgi:hypothetical protein